ncbi:MAG: DUF1553 domain-containing protein [Planctomycetota bacterium]|nr:MAG: DUF1553 domain-containing protein [Planctomycetota bacterium]
MAMNSRAHVIALAGLLVLVAAPGKLRAQGQGEDAQVDFVRDVQPLLRRHCFRCHGPKEQEGSLALNRRESTLGTADSGEPIVVAGQADDSLLIKRLTDAEYGDLMPLDAEPLSDAEIGTLRSWIDQGASWPDAVAEGEHWAYRRIERPPVPHVENAPVRATPIDHFVLRRLGATGQSLSPEADRPRLLRRVSLALTGLPPTPDEVQAFIADASPDAYEKAVDRLLASPAYGERWAVPWLDLARYADSNGFQADQLRDNWAFRDWVIRAFNADMPFDEFVVAQIAGDLLPDATIDQRIATGFHRMTPCNVEAGVHPEANRHNQIVDRVNTTATVFLGTTLECAQCHDHKYDPFTQQDYYRLFAYFNNTPLEVENRAGVTWDFYGPRMELPQNEMTRQELEAARQRLAALESRRAIAAERSEPDFEQWLAARNADDDANEGSDGQAAGQATGESKLTKPQRKKLRAQFDKQDPKLKQLDRQLARARRELKTLEPDTTLVMVEMDQPRETFVLTRGDYESPAERVQPGTPAVLPELHRVESTDDRLELARWLTSRENPLLARVTVNRWWGRLFGHPLVATPEDFGSQGEAPSHPELLDWLAAELIDSGWSMKHAHKQIVMSATFKQSAKATPQILAADPHNRLLARGPRFRLPAEAVRDNALAVSGLLSRRMYGPPIMPYQPDNLWRSVGRNQPTWKAAEDEDRFRRGVYVVCKRAAPYPSFINFDAPDRGSCTVNRPRSNTPLQALTLLNDPAYAEMALALADRVLSESPGASDAGRLDYAVRVVLARSGTPRELELLTGLLAAERELLAKNPKLAAARTKPRTAALQLQTRDKQELAVWFAVANALLNLDETMTQ